MTVYFHGNFGLNREYMAGVLALLRKKGKPSDKELGALFDYGAPFGARYRSWLHYAGLMEQRLPLQLTPMGEVVAKKDPKLKKLTTMWFMHHELTIDPIKVESWHIFANDFLSKKNSFTRDELLMGLADKLGPHSQKHFGMGSKLNTVIAKKLIECYTADHALAALGLIEQSGVDEYKVLKSRRLGPWKTPEALEKAYRQ
jgi:hypothetical protein